MLLLLVCYFGESTDLEGSAIGGTKETQEMMDFCAEHDITADVEVIRMEQVSEAYERILKSDIKYRFVIDVKQFSKQS